MRQQPQEIAIPSDDSDLNIAPAPLCSEPALGEMIDRVLELHRHGDAYITFGRKDANGALKPTDSFRASSSKRSYKRGPG